jgi:hypothetical protein
MASKDMEDAQAAVLAGFDLRGAVSEAERAEYQKTLAHWWRRLPEAHGRKSAE